jgi:hypothetical protein
VRTVWSGYADLAAVTAAAGAPAAGRVRLLMPPAGPYFALDSDLRTWTGMSWTTNGAVLHAGISVTATGLRAEPVAAPAGATPLDAFTVDSLTAKRFGA